MTINQLSKKLIRKKIKKQNKRLALKGCPQKKGMCVKVYTVSPKKPNSAVRKIAFVSLTNKLKIIASIPGEKHTLQKHSQVLVRGGRVRDIPGVRYKIIRGKYDLKEVIRRTQGRSKYGTKNWKKSIKVKKRLKKKLKQRFKIRIKL